MSRKLSWVFGVIAYVGAPLWAWLAIRSDYEAQMQAYKFIKCGTPMIGIMLSACAVSGVASLLAAGLGVASYRRVSGQRPKIRVLEIAALSLPLVVAFLIAGLILWA
jgi:hypothetical protein